MNLGATTGMKIGMVTLAGVLACIPAYAQDGVGGISDPTRPAGASSLDAAEPVFAGPVLQSTVVSPTMRRAVISGKSYVVGDQFGAARIVDIRSYEVILEQGGRETRLRLVPPVAKDTAAPGANETMRKTP